MPWARPLRGVARRVPAREKDTVLVHVYRAEVSRSDTWRSRLDNTTNWALTVAAAVASITFASREASHGIIIVGSFLITTFLVVEARRYRYYDLWIRRVRLLEDGFVTSVLRDETIDPDALRELADLFARPRLFVSFWDAIGLRFRRTYAPMFLVLLAGWLFKLIAHPTVARTAAEVIERAHVGWIPGPVVIAVAVLAVCLGAFIWVRSFLQPLPSGELRARARGRRPLSAIFRLRGGGEAEIGEELH